jgi:hypothetical protein
MAAVLLLLTAGGCLKKDVGFLSDYLYYVENPVVIRPGVPKSTATIEADGSSSPLQVKIVAIRDVKGASADSQFFRGYELPSFAGTVTYADSTLALLDKKLIKDTLAPLKVFSPGGRMQFSGATRYLNAGNYTVDFEVSNTRGVKRLNNLVTFQLLPVSDTLYGGEYAGYSNADGVSISTFAENPVISISYQPSTERRVVFKFYDAQGKLYNVAKGGIGTRKGRWNFRHFAPYYPEVRTDTSVEYKYPSVPGEFPVYKVPDNIGITGRGNYGTFFAIPGSQVTGATYDLYIFTDQAFFKDGIHTISIRMRSGVTWKQ